MSRHAVIIGAGVGGLSAAVTLSSRPDWEVTVVEARSSPGGKVGVEHHRGIRFGTGPSLLTLPSIVGDVLAEHSLELESELDLFQPSPVTRYHFGDGSTLDVAGDLEQTIENVAQTFGDDAADQFRRFTDYARTIWEAAAPHFIFGPSPTAITAVKLGLTAMRDLMAIDSRSTMLDAVNDRIDDPRLRNLFLRYATFNGSDPRRAPATLHCIAWVDLGIGGWGIEGGMFELAKALEDVATRAGTRFVYDSPATSIRRRSDQFQIASERQRIDADAVIVNADVRHFIDDLWTPDGNLDLSVDAPPSMSGWNAVVEARRRPQQRRPAHSIVFPNRDYIREFADLFDHGQTPEDPMIYLSAPEKAHRTESWENSEPLFVMTNAPPVDETTTPTDWTAHEQRVLDKLRQQRLIDDDDRVIWRRTPRQLAEEFPGSRGSIYGAASNSRWAAFRRPPNRVPGVDGLYLSGGSAHPGGGLPLCIQSGRRAVTELLDDFQ